MTTPARKRRVRISILIATLGLLAGGAAAGAWWYSNAPVRAVQDAVRQELRDPESAKFGLVVFNPKTRWGCGYVNGRNAFGGYAGFRHFTVSDTGQVEFEPGDSISSDTKERMHAVQLKISYLEYAKHMCGDH